MPTASSVSADDLIEFTEGSTGPVLTSPGQKHQITIGDFVASAGASTTLDGLTDVDTSGATIGDIFVKTSDGWGPSPPATISSSAAQAPGIAAAGATGQVSDAGHVHARQGVRGQKSYESGRLYRAQDLPGFADALLTQAEEWAVPFYCHESHTFTGIYFGLTVVGSTNSVVRLAVYNNSTAGDKPGTLILDAGTVATTSGTGNKSITSLSIPLVKDTLYWIGITGQGSPSPNQPKVAGAYNSVPYVSPATTDGLSGSCGAYVRTGKSSTMNDWSAWGVTAFSPNIALLA